MLTTSPPLQIICLPDNKTLKVGDGRSLCRSPEYAAKLIPSALPSSNEPEDRQIGLSDVSDAIENSREMNPYEIRHRIYDIHLSIYDIMRNMVRIHSHKNKEENYHDKEEEDDDDSKEEEEDDDDDDEEKKKSHSGNCVISWLNSWNETKRNLDGWRYEYWLRVNYILPSHSQFKTFGEAVASTFGIDYLKEIMVDVDQMSLRGFFAITSCWEGAVITILQDLVHVVKERKLNKLTSRWSPLWTFADSKHHRRPPREIDEILTESNLLLCEVRPLESLKNQIPRASGHLGLTVLITDGYIEPLKPILTWSLEQLRRSRNEVWSLEKEDSLPSSPSSTKLDDKENAAISDTIPPPIEISSVDENADQNQSADDQGEPIQSDTEELTEAGNELEDDLFGFELIQVADADE